MAYVFRPMKPPPKLYYTTLSSEAQKTLEDLQRKYANLLTYVQTPTVPHCDAANYYKSIYNTSFRKCFSTAYSEKGQDENSQTHFINRRPFAFHPENNGKLNTTSSIEHVHHTLKGSSSSKFEKKDSKIRPETEVFLEYRPSDEEIAESVLQLTQRTSHPDSPSLDLNWNLEEDQQLDEYVSKQSVSKGPDNRNYCNAAYLSPSTIENSRSEPHESYWQPDNYFQGDYKELHNSVSVQESLRTTRSMVQKEGGITDLFSVANEVNLENMDHSPVIFSSLDENNASFLCSKKDNTKKGKNKHFVEANNTHNHKETKDTSKAMEVADFELSLSGCEFSQTPYNSQHNFRDSFQNRTDSCIEQDCHLKDSCGQGAPFEKEQMANNKYGSEAADIPLQTFVANRSSGDSESPFLEASQTKEIKPPVVEVSTSAHSTSKIAGCAVQQKIETSREGLPVPYPPQSYTLDYEEDDKASGHPSPVKASTSRDPDFMPIEESAEPHTISQSELNDQYSERSELPKAEQQLNLLEEDVHVSVFHARHKDLLPHVKINFFQSGHYKKGSTCKDHIQIEKRRNKQCSDPGTKKFRPSFRPPYKDRLVLNAESETVLSENSTKQLGTPLCSVPDIVSFPSLSSENQTEAWSLLKYSQSLVLTLLYNTSQTLVTTFYSAADHAKKKNSTLQPIVVGIVILDESSTTSSFLIPSEFICRDDVKAALLSILVSKNITKIIANCKDFLIGVHRLCSLNSEHGIPCENIEDPVIACWLVDPDNQPASFKQMCRTSEVELASNGENWLAHLQLTPKLMHSFRHKLKANKLWSVFTQIEMKLIPVLACMEIQTIKVDTAIFVKFSDILKSKIKKLEETVYKEAGRKFSLNSHVQLRQILYEELELDKKLAPDVKIIKTDVSNQKSTCESSLKLLAIVHPLPALILEYRQVQKLMSTYVDGMMSCVTNGSIMTHWDQTAAATGRLTSSQPNIQAVPKTVITVSDFQPNYVIAGVSIQYICFIDNQKAFDKVQHEQLIRSLAEIGSEKMLSVDIHAREPFISRPGYVFLAADFQQTELRLLAHLSGDDTLQSLFKNTTGEDVFISLTKQWQNKASEEVTSADREQTKRVVYSVMYGVGKDKLSEYLKVKPDIAQDIITSFLLQFPAISSFTKKCWAYAQEFGYTETVSGRRRYFPHINSISPVLRAQAQRQAVNFCVQGSAADICKLAMLAVEGQLQKNSHLSCREETKTIKRCNFVAMVYSRLLLQIHDELIWEIPEDQLLETKDVIQQVIEDPEALCGPLFCLQVPLTVAFSSGKSWAHMNPFA